MGSPGVEVLVASRSSAGVDQFAERVEFFSLFRRLDLTFQSFCLNIGWLYTRLVASNSFAPEYREDYRGDDVARPTRLTNSIQEFMAMYTYLVYNLCIIN